jgi:signal transduction histidine kinase
VQPVQFPMLIEDLFVTVRPMAEERGSALELEHRGEPVTITSDPRRVRQILLNLLSNAIKFGQGNPIKVTSTRRPDGGLCVEVVDHGIGIAAEDLPRVFDEFVQLSRAPDHEGTGLGLPISRRLALLLQGELSAESRPGEGSTFRLALPPALDARLAVEQALPLIPAHALTEEQPVPVEVEPEMAGRASGGSERRPRGGGDPLADHRTEGGGSG